MTLLYGIKATSFFLPTFPPPPTPLFLVGAGGRCGVETIGTVGAQLSVTTTSCGLKNTDCTGPLSAAPSIASQGVKLLEVVGG